MYQGQHQDMDLFSTQLKNVSTYLHTETWVVNKSGVVIMDSKNGSRVHTTIPDFDPTATGNRSYTIGTYYKLFDQNVLSVSAPVTGNYTTYGYVLIHLPISEIANSQEPYFGHSLHDLCHYLWPVADHPCSIYHHGISASAKDRSPVPMNTLLAT